MPDPGHPWFDLIAAGLLTCPSCNTFPPGRAVALNAADEAWPQRTHSYGHSSGSAPDSLFKNAQEISMQFSPQSDANLYNPR